MLKWLGALVDSNEKQIKRLQPIIDKINELESEYEKLTSEGLKAKTAEFKARIAETTADIRQQLEELRAGLEEVKQKLSGSQEDLNREEVEGQRKRFEDRIAELEKEQGKAESNLLNDLLPEAFAAVREAAKRTIGQRHFDVQLMGGMVLHQGKIAEMKTGEGKTLVATLPLYLNSLTGKGCHLVTVNDYLSKRDPHWMGPIYHALGLSVGSITGPKSAGVVGGESYIYDPNYYSGDTDWPYFRHVERKEAYAADVTYGTNNEFGFDYLRDNMVIDLSKCVQRELNFAIVDEVDNILIDEARTPLIISGPADKSTLQKYRNADSVVRHMTGKFVTDKEEMDAKREGIDIEEGFDYLVNDKSHSVKLTDEGVVKSQKKLGIKDLHEFQLEWEHYIRQGITAHELYKKNREYVVKDGQVIIVDEFTGRMMFGRRYSEGLHQAIEAKEIGDGERVDVQEETRTYATITFQNYFRMYKKLAGMTGTAVTEAEEFFKIYKLDVMVISTNKPMMRQDFTDQVYKDEQAKFKAVVKEVEEMHKNGRPVLIGTVSVEKSEMLSGLIKRAGIPHLALNAKDNEHEAYLVAQAGRTGAITLATNMAGRGVDIILGGNPEGIAKEQLRQENKGRVEKESGGAQKLLESLKSDYEKRAQQLDGKYKPIIADLMRKNDETGESLRTSEKEYKSASPFWGLFEKLDSAQMIRTEAVNERKPIPTDYRALEEELERALFEEANKVESTHSTHDIREALRSAEKIAGNYQTTIQKYDASVIEAVSAGDTLEKTYVEMNKVRQDWLRSLEKLETILLYRIEPDAVEACNRARQAYLHASEELEKIQKQYDSERARDNDAYNKKKHEYELVLQRTRNRIENAPEYRARLQELVEQYSPSCALGREKVVSLGGLHVIGTERHEARRIDNQLRGRSGRQGDPGSSRFYVSLEDDVMRRFGGDRIKTVMNWVGVGDDIPIENKLVTSSLESAQVKVEGYHFDMRKHLVDYDDVVNTQRGIIYGDRRKSLEGADLKANILSMVKEEIRGIVTAHTGGEASPEEWTGLLTEVSAIIPLTGEFDAGSLTGLKPGEIEERLVKYAESLYEQLEKTLGADNMRMLERLLMLRVIDEHWVQHLTDMDHMRAGVGLQAVAQRDPLAVYKNEGHAMFQSMMESIRHKVALTIFHVNIQRQPPQKQSASPQSRPAVHPIPKQTTSPMAKVAAASRGNADVKQTAKVAGKKVGRNDPCPCGSGKKYKHCCGK